MSGTDRQSGVVAAGHPLTARAGAEILRQGGNAVDAAVCSVLTSFATESALTGFGAGGFMMVRPPDGRCELIDFFVAAPGMGGVERGEELVPISVSFDAATSQVFNVGAASCGVPGMAAGLALALERFGSVPVGELIGPGVRFAREGAPVNREQAFLFSILKPIYTLLPECRELYAPEGRFLREGDLFRFPDLGDALERFAEEGAGGFFDGEVAEAISEFVCERGGTLSPADLRAYEPVVREPVRARFDEHLILTNPPPSSGGILIAYCLELLDRIGSTGVVEIARVMRAANRARGESFIRGLESPGYADRFLAGEELDRIAAARSSGGEPGEPGSALGSTTHLVALDRDGMCASVTCSNGTGSGLVVPGTGVHLNNMCGEEDLNPLGFHKGRPGSRIASMMAPTVAVRDGRVVAGLGSAGSNRIRSAILQTVVNMLDRGMAPQAAVDAGRVHFERGRLQAEPGVDEAALSELEREGMEVVRWRRPNLFFGGVQAVGLDPATGDAEGGGDPRRGGAVAYA